MTISVQTEADYIKALLSANIDPDDDDYFERAMMRARKRAVAAGGIAMQPARWLSGFEVTRGQLFYVLGNVNGELARFAVSASGRLRIVE